MENYLILSDETRLCGKPFGYLSSAAGEVVFATGMTGYPQAFTDPSFKGQILVMTYPIIGNYGVPADDFWESAKMHISGLIVSQYIDTPSHSQSKITLSQWLKKEKIPALEIKDTRFLTQHLRNFGTALGKIVIGRDLPFYDPNRDDLLSQVTSQEVIFAGKGRKTVLIIDCGAKKNIEKCFLKRGVKTVTVPWNFDVFSRNGQNLKFDALFISNGPGDPKMADKTITTVKRALENKIPILGICLGNQILALAAGGNTYKLKFGHRSQNQPCILEGSNRCYTTTQNHGFAVGVIPEGYNPWFVNANDNTNEGIIHKKLPVMSVQFHPEATPGPVDTEWIFDYFLEKL